MTELERRALLGDRQAQDEFTRQKELLPCPKCHSRNLTIEDDSQTVYDVRTLGYLYSTAASIVYVFCEDCGTCSEAETVGPGEDYEDAEKRLIESWNTRPAPPVGRCKDCTYKEKATVNAKGFLICPVSGMEISDYDFCSYFQSIPSPEQ